MSTASHAVGLIDVGMVFPHNPGQTPVTGHLRARQRGSGGSRHARARDAGFISSKLRSPNQRRGDRHPSLASKAATRCQASAFYQVASSKRTETGGAGGARCCRINVGLREGDVSSPATAANQRYDIPRHRRDRQPDNSCALAIRQRFLASAAAGSPQVKDFVAGLDIFVARLGSPF